MAQKWDKEESLKQAYRASERQLGQDASVLQWMKQRSATLKESITAHDVVRYHGVQLKSALDSEEQLSCPFHGKDNKPSARIYPASGRSDSHLWCFTCQKSWDIFGLWREFMGHGPEVKFPTILFELEKTFGIIRPEGPDAQAPEDKGPSELDLEVDQLFDVCEKRIKEARYKYEPTKLFRTGQVLDQLHHRWDERAIKAVDVRALLRQVLDRIGEHIRAA